MGLAARWPHAAALGSKLGSTVTRCWARAWLARLRLCPEYGCAGAGMRVEFQRERGCASDRAIASSCWREASRHRSRGNPEVEPVRRGWPPRSIPAANTRFTQRRADARLARQAVKGEACEGPGTRWAVLRPALAGS